jgi:hypothetical protein
MDKAHPEAFYPTHCFLFVFLFWKRVNEKKSKKEQLYITKPPWQHI